MQRASSTGWLTRETRVPSKSMLRRRTSIVAEPALWRQLLQHKCRELTLSANGRRWATQTDRCNPPALAHSGSILRLIRFRAGARVRERRHEIGLRTGDGT